MGNSGLWMSYAREVSFIEYMNTQVRRRQSHGAVERLHQIIQEEFYKITFRKKLYPSLESIQADLDEFVALYNAERTNQGRFCQGGLPCSLFCKDSPCIRNLFLKGWREKK